MGWKIRVLQLFFVGYVLLDILVLILAVYGTRVGQSDLMIELLDFDGYVASDVDVPLSGSIVAGIVGAMYIAVTIIMFLSVNTLLGTARSGALASVKGANAMRRIGQSLIALWVLIICMETLAPIAMFLSDTPDLEVAFALFDLKVIFAIIGMAFWLISDLAREADDMKKELASVV